MNAPRGATHPQRWPVFVFGAIAVLAMLGAFVGLGRSSLWIDELFTLHLVHHDLGLKEVWRRALTDTQPPLYDVLLYAWTRLSGYAPWAMRLPSAVSAVAAIVVFGYGARKLRLASPAAIAFACAVAALSGFWFQQSQNIRSYALSMLLAAVLQHTVWRVQAAIRDGLPVLSCQRRLYPLLAVGLLASFNHSYLLLATGFAMALLLLQLPAWRPRIVLMLGGLLILLLNVAYYRQLMHDTHQDLHHLWFRNDMGFFAAQTHQAIDALATRWVEVGLVVLLCSLLWRRLQGEPAEAEPLRGARQATLLSTCVLLGVAVFGIAVSLLVAPSYSDRNLLTCAPFAWWLLARLYDVAGPRPGARRIWPAVVFLAIALASHLPVLRGRLVERNEAWQESAHYVASLSACRQQPLLVILPFKFGPPEDSFRRLAERDFYGHFLTTSPLTAMTPAELGSPSPALSVQWQARAQQFDQGGCGVLAWGVHDLNEDDVQQLALDLARQPGIAPRTVEVLTFESHYRRRLQWPSHATAYVLQLRPASAESMPVTTAGTASADISQHWLVQYLGTAPGSAVPVDLFRVRRWPAHGQATEDYLAQRRLACSATVEEDRQDVWHDPRLPACGGFLPSTLEASQLKP
ncbi:hypothetical protein [Rhodanobacter sp. DHG33]|uniref:hypothetical protein n=1 Tax=Rhodanobacter sp. DHG33 TaxID=2775921 RepID=UPI0017867A22|nr:hypothetical protein [Rhodanobacter sp. DHG33]MBD8900316.1 hypothetical protein [Rhodanobacter sp. DHG33]